MSVLALEGEEFEFIWNNIQKLQLIYHPRYSNEGQIDYSALLNLKSKKRIIVLLDRNLLSGMLKLAQDGSLKDESEMRIIALLMTWVIMNGFYASPGLALKEYATKINAETEAKKELQLFQNIFNYYPSMLWLRLAEGIVDNIPPCPLPIEPIYTSIRYNEDDDHLIMHLAEMLHIVYLCRQQCLSPVDKMIEFLNWNYKNLIICESTLTYIAMLFTSQTGIKAPKNSCSDNFDKILDGCRNQAWDINYLSVWSCFHYKEENLNDLFMFATNDNQLKMIFINTYAKGGVISLINSLFSKKDAAKIIEIIETNQKNRIKPDFGSNPKDYYRCLIGQEKQRILNLMT